MHLIQEEPHILAEDICTTEPKKPIRVSFAEEVDVHEIDDYDFEWNEAAWYQQHDYSHFREERRETAAAYKGSLTGTKRARLFDPSKHCLRGVENHCMPRTNQARRERRFAVIEAVLHEQGQQRRQGVFDPVSIRLCAVVISSPASMLATERGELDAQYVVKQEEYHKPSWRSLMPNFRAGPTSKIMSIPKPWNE